jgi:hypothetical protein
MVVKLSWRRGSHHDEYRYWLEDDDDLAIATIDVGRSGGRIERVKMTFPKVTIFVLHSSGAL